jgi:ABC-type nitrate/sulfonate/bicarbonate transport system substrate-binding protein
VKFKIALLALLLVFGAHAGAVRAQAVKLNVAYPTTVGSMAVLWVTKEARLFEKHGLQVELIYIGGSSKVVQAMLAREIPIAEIAIPAVIQANMAGADLVMLAGPNHKPVKRSWSSRKSERTKISKGKNRCDPLRHLG